MSSLRRILVFLFGRWQWEAPPWLSGAGAAAARVWRHMAARPAQAAALGLALVVAGGGLGWYWLRPKPHYVTYVVTAPGLTEYNVNGIAVIKPMTVVFSESTAPLKLIG